MGAFCRSLSRMAASLCCVAFLWGCSAPAAVEETPAPTQSAVKEAAVNVSVSNTLIGFVAPESEELSLYSAKHGFLRTAETLGYPAKLYPANMGQDSVEAVERAAEDGCKGLLIWSPNNANAAALQKAAELKLYAVVPYYSAQGEGVSANVVADVLGYTEEVAMGVAERMVERQCKAGKILVYGENPADTYEGFKQAIATYYPQYNVAYFTRTAQDGQAAADELADHILWNRDIKGMFCTDVDGASIARRATEQADRTFKKDGAPENAGKETDANTSPAPGPQASPAPDAASASGLGPSATPVPEGLIKSIVISIAGYGISDENIALMQDNDIYAFVLEPYYEASAQSVMLLDRLLAGQSVPASVRLNMPIVRMASLDKYRLLYEQVQEWFGLNTPAPATPSPAA
ncbi:MAG TPA: substrate-binding domain-containing protein [Feifaniaceae bacterium]|nr:substrate-binding domain-containing protein [Feifaniaceae bacterium]